MNPNELRVTGRELQVFVKNVTRKEEEKDVTSDAEGVRKMKSIPGSKSEEDY